ncbi:hypothetical protein [Adonisia turfae]|uniref:Uncharacterized protein n=1 Tax=Adonisia turfae CCMR0081 TaxID=2292702 RepID=A0A6M0RR33_9CYAN|nr:hypothetical protein [Adonisia turfae]NEZ58705.1 hypothetical protein [Adonisia turfae CCMR0081]
MNDDRSTYAEMLVPSAAEHGYAKVWLIEDSREYFKEFEIHVSIQLQCAKSETRYIDDHLLLTFLGLLDPKDQKFPETYAQALAGVCIRCKLSQYSYACVQKMVTMLDPRDRNKVLREELIAAVLDDDATPYIFLKADIGIPSVFPKAEIATNDSQDTDGTLENSCQKSRKKQKKQKKKTYKLYTAKKNGEIRFNEDNNEPQPSKYIPFNLKILADYSLDVSSSKLNLKNWIYKYLGNQPSIQNILATHGFHRLTDWAYLNRRCEPLPKENLVSCLDIKLLKVYHDVYRRDRLSSVQNQYSSNSRKCPPPNLEQLNEMLTLLRKEDIYFESPERLLQELQQLARQLKDFDLSRIGSGMEPIELPSSENGISGEHPELPKSPGLDAEGAVRTVLSQTLNDEFVDLLDQGIQFVVETRHLRLQKGRYKEHWPKFTKGLKLTYLNNLFLQEIATGFGLDKQKMRRILDLENLVWKTRDYVLDKLTERVLIAIGESQLSSSVDFITNLEVNLAEYADDKSFRDACSELKAGRNRVFYSLYAQRLQIFLSEQI